MIKKSLALGLLIATSAPSFAQDMTYVRAGRMIDVVDLVSYVEDAKRTEHQASYRSSANMTLGNIIGHT